MTFHIFLRSRIFRSKFSWILYIHIFICGIISSFIQGHSIDWFDFLSKKLLPYMTITSNVNGGRMQQFHSKELFLLSGFPLADIEDSQDSRGEKGVIIIPIYHVHLHRNIQAFICSFLFEMTTFYF